MDSHSFENGIIPGHPAVPPSGSQGGFSAGPDPDVVPRRARRPAQLQGLDQVGVPPPGQAVGQQRRALRGMLDPGPGSTGNRTTRPNRARASSASAAISGRSAAAPDR
jgi:hypothetical protein